jgi:UTP--glucose-1-phosphate uridylyltransferase
LDLAEAEACPVSAVQSTREHLIHQYGTIQGKRRIDRPDVYVVEEVIEKPHPTLAELRLQVPGLRSGHYLCFFGMHVITSAIFDLLEDLVARDAREGGLIQLTTALNTLARTEKYLALETQGARHNLGVRYGIVEAQIAFALAGVDRDHMLSTLLETVVKIEQG